MSAILPTVLSLLMSTADAAPSQSHSFPPELIFAGKPIDPLCFSTLDMKSTSIDLNNCGISKSKYTAKGLNTELIKKGFTGYDWQDPQQTAYPSQGYSYYKSFPAGNNQFWIYSINNSGGNGEFTAIEVVKRLNTTTLATKSIANGDRCNGGLSEVTGLQNNKLRFSVNLTAYDLITLTNNNSDQLKAYDDIAACATCCVAKAFYQTNEKLNPQLTYVELNKIKTVTEMSTQGKYAACFNKFFTSHVVDGQTKLDETALKKFTSAFNDTCVRPDL